MSASIMDSLLLAARINEVCGKLANAKNQDKEEVITAFIRAADDRDYSKLEKFAVIVTYERISKAGIGLSYPAHDRAEKILDFIIEDCGLEV